MNTFQLLMVLLGQGIFMALSSVAVIYGIANVFGIGEEVMDIRITTAFFFISCIALYGSSFGIFAGVQKDSCGEVKSWKQVAVNAMIPTITHIVLFALITIIPWFQGIVGNLLPPDTPAFGKSAVAFAYFVFWATLLGGALGGTMSGSCKAEDTFDPLKPLGDLELEKPLGDLELEKPLRKARTRFGSRKGYTGLPAE